MEPPPKFPLEIGGLKKFGRKDREYELQRGNENV